MQHHSIVRNGLLNQAHRCPYSLTCSTQRSTKDPFASKKSRRVRPVSTECDSSGHDHLYYSLERQERAESEKRQHLGQLGKRELHDVPSCVFCSMLWKIACIDIMGTIPIGVIFYVCRHSSRVIVEGTVTPLN